MIHHYLQLRLLWGSHWAGRMWHTPNDMQRAVAPNLQRTCRSSRRSSIYVERKKISRKGEHHIGLIVPGLSTDLVWLGQFDKPSWHNQRHQMAGRRWHKSMSRRRQTMMPDVENSMIFFWWFQYVSVILLISADFCWFLRPLGFCWLSPMGKLQPRPLGVRQAFSQLRVLLVTWCGLIQWQLGESKSKLGTEASPNSSSSAFL